MASEGRMQSLDAPSRGEKSKFNCSTPSYPTSPGKHVTPGSIKTNISGVGMANETGENNSPLTPGSCFGAETSRDANCNGFFSPGAVRGAAGEFSPENCIAERVPKTNVSPDLMSTKDASRGQLEALQIQLAAAKEEAAAHKEEAQQAIRNATHLNVKFKDAQAHAVTLEASRDEARTHVLELEGSLEHAWKLIKDEQEAARAAMHKMSSSQQATESQAATGVAESLKESQADNERLKATIQSLEKSFADSSEELQLKIGAMRAELASEKARVYSLRAANSEIKNELFSELENASTLKAQLAEARSSSRAASFAESSSKSQAASIEAELKAVRAEMAGEIEALRESKRALEFEVHTMEGVLQSMEASGVAERAAHGAHVHELEQQASEARENSQAACSAIRDELVSLSAKMSASEAKATAELAEKSAQIDVLEKELADSQAAVTRAHSERYFSSQLIVNLKKSLEHARTSEEAAETRTRDTTSLLKETEKKLEATNSALEKVTSERDKLSDDLKQAETNLIHGQIEFEKLASEAATAESFWKQAEDDAACEIEWLRRCLEKQTATFEEVQATLEKEQTELHSQLSACEAAADTSALEVRKLSDRLAVEKVKWDEAQEAHTAFNKDVENDFMVLQANFQATQSAMEAVAERLFSEKRILRAASNPRLQLM